MDSRVSWPCDNCGGHVCHVRERWQTLPVPQADFLDKVVLLPAELQEVIYRYYIIPERPKYYGSALGAVRTCCPPALIRVNKFWNEKIAPLLWEVIHHNRANIENLLSLLTVIRRTHPSRFERLMGYVKTLDLGTLDGAALSWELGYIIDDVDSDGTRWVYDIISYFKNLRQFSIYVVTDSTNIRKEPQVIYERLGKNFTKLQRLHVGGVIPSAILSSIFSGSARTLRHVEMINLHQSIWRGNDTPEANRPYEDGVNKGPDGMLFLTDDICRRMTSLQTLHLCKLANMEPVGSDRSWSAEEDDSEIKVYASGLSWPFARSSELEILQEWALLLRHTAPYLRRLTLENRFLVSPDKLFEPDNKVERVMERANSSVEASREVLLPLFENTNCWPRLEEMHLCGMVNCGESVGGWAVNLDRVVKKKMPVKFQLAGVTYLWNDNEAFTHISEPDQCIGID